MVNEALVVPRTMMAASPGVQYERIPARYATRKRVEMVSPSYSYHAPVVFALRVLQPLLNRNQSRQKVRHARRRAFVSTHTSIARAADRPAWPSRRRQALSSKRTSESGRRTPSWRYTSTAASAGSVRAGEGDKDRRASGSRKAEGRFRSCRHRHGRRWSYRCARCCDALLAPEIRHSQRG
jgi:hypothetical protein